MTRLPLFVFASALLIAAAHADWTSFTSTTSLPLNKDLSMNDYLLKQSSLMGGAVGFWYTFHLENGTFLNAKPLKFGTAERNATVGIPTSDEFHGNTHFEFGAISDPCVTQFPEEVNITHMLSFYIGANTDAAVGTWNVTIYTSSLQNISLDGSYTLQPPFSPLFPVTYMKIVSPYDATTITLKPDRSATVIVAGGSSCPTASSSTSPNVIKKLTANAETIIDVDRGYREIWLQFSDYQSQGRVDIKVKDSVASPTSSSPSTPPSSSNAPAAKEDGNLVWLWVVLGVVGAVCIVGAIVIIVRKRRNGYTKF